ncbi:MAG: hypothetical protein M3T96_05260 [Acidobacteriota bacterium]|nr:hypothetical protein [Acidobacteriota bacterium]
MFKVFKPPPPFFFGEISYTAMSKKKKKPERPIFDSIRKPTAPPGQRFGGDQPDEKANPARRKVKHKKPEDTES